MQRQAIGQGDGERIYIDIDGYIHMQFYMQVYPISMYISLYIYIYICIISVSYLYVYIYIYIYISYLQHRQAAGVA